MADATSPTDLLSLVNALRGQATAAPEPLPDMPGGGFSPAQSTKWIAWRNAKIAAQHLPPNVTQYMENNPDYGERNPPHQINPAAPSNTSQPPALIWPHSLDSRQGPNLTPHGAPQSPGMTEDWFHNYQPGATGPVQPISDLLTALRASPSPAPLLARVGGAPAPPTSPADQPPGAAADYARRGFIQSTPYLNPAVAPRVPAGAARPLGPGEWIRNPDGSWSSEESTTVSPGDNLDLMGGKATVIPTLWVKDGKPYMASEDEAQQLAVQSGLSFPTFADTKAAEAFANQREAIWEKTPDGHSGAQAPLWSYPKGSEYIEPPATPTATAGGP